MFNIKTIVASANIWFYFAMYIGTRKYELFVQYFAMPMTNIIGKLKLIVLVGFEGTHKLFTKCIICLT